MKKYLAALLAFVLIATLFPSLSLAAGATYKLVINEKEVISDVAPIIIEDRAMLPVSVVSSNLGAEVEWNSKTRVADVRKDDLHLSFNIDTKRVKVNGVERNLNYPLVVKEGRTLLPAAFLAEQLGAEIEWNGKERMVSIQSLKKYSITLNDEKLDVPAPEFVNDELYLAVESFAPLFGFEVKNENRQLLFKKDNEETILSLINGKVKRGNEYLVETTPRPQQKNGVWYVSANSVNKLFDTETTIDDKDNIVNISGKVDPIEEPEQTPPPVIDTNDMTHVSTEGNRVSLTFEESIRQPSYTVLAKPHRLVVDIPNTTVGAFKPLKGESIGNLSDYDLSFKSTDFVKEIRYSQFTPDTVRVVIDLSKRADYTATVKDNTITLSLKHVNYLVYIDAGHGDKDPGASGVNRLINEATFNLKVALKVEKMMAGVTGVKTVLTRRDDTFLELSERVALANGADADMFISIHANAIGSATVGGTETYYYKSNSIELANIAHRHLLAATGFEDRRAKYGNFHVIRETTMPSILLEAGFLTNAREEKLLASDEYQTRVAQSIVNTIKEYFQL